MKDKQLPQRSDTVDRFKDRLEQVIRRAGVSRTAFAASVGIDRSTLSQILSPESQRLPRVETLAAIATSAQVSIDWLVGLSEEGALSASIIPVLEFSPSEGSPSDAQLTRWRSEAAGYKIRHVPATLPDALKTPAVIEYEFRSAAVASPAQRRETSHDHLSYERRADTDTEICTCIQEIESFAVGHGIWSKLSKKVRKKQLARMAELTEELYPSFRWFMYDALARYSVPLTIFGPKRAVVYVGQMYLLFNGREHIRILTRHFDELIRAAVVDARAAPEKLRELERKL